MRLKTKLVVAIASLVFLIATMLSALYMNRLLDQHIQQSYESTDVIAHQFSLQHGRRWRRGCAAAS